MIDNTMLKTAAYALKDYYMSGAYAENFDSKELADIVVNHAAAAGVSAMAAGVFPGVGALLASGIAVGAIWSMYVKIANYLNLKLGKDVLKAIASAVLTNVVTQLAGLLVFELAVGFIPGASIIAAGVVNFGITYVAGLIYLKALTGIFSVGGNPDMMTDSQIKEQFNSASKSVDAKAVFGEAKKAFNQMKKDGSLNEKGNQTDIKG